MKKNVISQPLLMNCKCNYSHMILGTYNLVFSCQFQKKYNKEFSYPIILRGNLKEKGSRFILKMGELYIFYEISDIIITDYYAIFKFHVYKTIPETFEFDHFVEVRYENENEFTLFIVHSVQDKYLTQDDILLSLKNRKEIYINIENSLRQFELLKMASVHQIINCKIELIWDIIRNMKILNKYNHLLADQIEYNGKLLKKDKIIKLIDKNNKTSYELIAKVKNCEIKKSKIEKEFGIQIIASKDKNSFAFNFLKKIIIHVYEYEEKCTFHLLFFFRDILSKDKFFIINKEKNLELIKFKNIVENYRESKLNKNELEKL